MELITDTKVCNLDVPILTQQEVGWLDVPVDDTLVMHCNETVMYLTPNTRTNVLYTITLHKVMFIFTNVSRAQRHDGTWRACKQNYTHSRRCQYQMEVIYQVHIHAVSPTGKILLIAVVWEAGGSKAKTVVAKR
jgi:hypothetical protein